MYFSEKLNVLPIKLYILYMRRAQDWAEINKSLQCLKDVELRLKQKVRVQAMLFTVWLDGLGPVNK